jgi:hypothetical protein
MYSWQQGWHDVTDEKCRMCGNNILGAGHFTALSYGFFLMTNCGDLLFVL